MEEKKIILFVDDGNISHIKDTIENSGFKIIPNEDLAAAKTEISKARIDGLVTDFYLGNDLGIDLIKYTRCSSEKNNNIPISLYTGASLDDIYLKVGGEQIYQALKAALSFNYIFKGIDSCSEIINFFKTQTILDEQSMEKIKKWCKTHNGLGELFEIRYEIIQDLMPLYIICQVYSTKIGCEGFIQGCLLKEKIEKYFNMLKEFYHLTQTEEEEDLMKKYINQYDSLLESIRNNTIIHNNNEFLGHTKMVSILLEKYFRKAEENTKKMDPAASI